MPVKSITYVLVNNLGGITNMLDNLVQYREMGGMPQDAILLNIHENNFSEATSVFGNGIPVTTYTFSKKDNWYHALGKLAKLSGRNAGVLIANDVYEMLALSYFNINKKVIQIVHDGYNLQLAVQYGDVVDVFISHTKFYYEVLSQLFPDRLNDIYHIPYGIPVLGKKRKTLAAGEAIKLVFLGRHDKRKGIFDLAIIEKLLEGKGIKTDWLILGKGPDTGELKKQWENASNVHFATPATNAEVLELISQRDVLVFPTKFEGFPVALLEAMSVGCVPVATDLPGGLRELVKNGINGFLCDMDNNTQFADRIEWLSNNRNELERISNHAYTEVTENYNAAVQSPKYQRVFEQIAADPAVPAHHKVQKKLGSRLDQPWLPNSITQLIRKRFSK